MKAIIEFNLDEPWDRQRHSLLLQAENLATFLFDLEQGLFRPARKHGYPDSVIGRRINQLIETNPDAVELIGLLEDLYFQMKTEAAIVDIE